MLDEIMDALIAAGLAVEGEMVKARYLPDPVRLLTIRRYSGEPADEDFDLNVTAKPRVQFEFRDAKSGDADAWAMAVWAWCHTVPGHVISPQCAGFSNISDPSDTGEDDNHHPLVTFNATLTRTAIVAGVAV